jgi:uncharacterized radical SAM superfamily Fe-S cluster-containing enzyme
MTEQQLLIDKLKGIEKRAKVLEHGLALPNIDNDVKDMIRFAIEDIDIMKRVFNEHKGEQYISHQKELLAQMNDVLYRLEDMKIIS